MRFMVIVKATRDTEAGILPTTEEFAAMGRFNEQLIEAGMMEAGEGLHPTAKGARIAFSDGTARVARGPFDYTSDLAAGFWMLKAGSLDEVIAYMQRAPFPSGEIEIRQVYAAEDFGEAFTPQLREKEERQRRLSAKR
ncbi:YciI family protein [Bradyrhizobium sp. HKCCYLS20291]|uniref:YciI family protein n=1 Tax=Bradyrhizobium sp. HKCCYLS20291 TaxID=3420766 RepID=UPI003EBC894A